MKELVNCENPKCKKTFWSKIKGGVPLDNLCKNCLNKIGQTEMRTKRDKIRAKYKKKLEKLKEKEKVKSNPEEKAPKPTPNPPKPRMRTPDDILLEIHWLEYRRAKEFPRLRKDVKSTFFNLRLLQANEIIVRTLKQLYQELEVAEKLGLYKRGKKKK